MASEITTFNENEQLTALEANRGLKRIQRKQRLGQQSFPTMNEDDGTIIHDFDRVIKRCEEFYTHLYSSQQTGGINSRYGSVVAPNNHLLFYCQKLKKH